MTLMLNSMDKTVFASKTILVNIHIAYSIVVSMTMENSVKMTLHASAEGPNMTLIVIFLTAKLLVQIFPTHILIQSKMNVFAMMITRLIKIKLNVLQIVPVS